MSLFPAYSGASKTSDNETENDDSTWLSLSSYKLNTKSDEKRTEEQHAKEQSKHNSPATSDYSSDTSSSSEHERRRRRKKKLRKSKQHDEILLKNVFENANFVEDKSCERIFLKIKKIFRPAAPRYKYMNCVIGEYVRPAKRHKKPRRYFDCRLMMELLKWERKSNESKEKENDKTQENIAEEDIAKETAFYNHSLGKDPFNVELWLEYVRFQDKVWLFEKTYKKGSIAKGARVTTERKLSILDKALGHNPNNETLTRERVLIAERVYPADELSAYLKNLVEKHPGNIILWQGYIEATQCSMAHCNTPAVLQMYNRCLTKLHQMRRSSAEEKYILEEKILCMLYQCGLFLRQAGLWEQLWTLLRSYLELTLASNDKSKFNVTSKLNDRQLLELEEVVLESQLPIHELWLRVEKLRESCHWLPWNSSERCEDPQRVVFVQDVSDLIHPITCTGNSFRLIVTILTLLKLPLLPCRHTTIQELGLDYVPWSLDTIETLYPVFFPLYPVNLKNDHFLKDATKFAVGPQYLKTHPAQEEYLTFLTDIIIGCGDCLQRAERTAIFVWWLRFERFLIVLNKQNRFKMPAGRQKRIKNMIKSFLMDEINRNNVVYYKEYAQIEYELGNFDSACKILKRSIEVESKGNPVLAILNESTRCEVCSLYRTLIEFYLTEEKNLDENREKAVYYLVRMTTRLRDDEIVTEEMIDEALNKYKDLIAEILQESQKTLAVCEHFLPDFLTDWIICYGWLLYLKSNTLEASTMIENLLEKMEQNDSVQWRKEVLMEWYVTIFYKTCTENLGAGMYCLFNDILHRALSLYPNNLYLLSVTCTEKSTSGCLGKPWWKLSKLLTSTGHAVPALFLVLMANQQLSKTIEEINTATLEDPGITLTTLKNRILSIFLRLTNLDICTKRCGLLWRLYLEFLYNNSDPNTCRKAYYAAVEECPWLKALYIDAAIYIPAELPQIQDLIIEKEIRLHVIPEELDVLRL